jgi:DNA-3-methyladenine glycosylase II
VYIGAESFVCTAGLTDRLRSTNQIATKAMQPHIHTDSDLDAGLAALSRADPRFGPLMATAGRPPLRRRPDGFAGLAAIIVAQQLSTASASAIWGRLAAAFDPLEHCSAPGRRGWRGSVCRGQRSAR